MDVYSEASAPAVFRSRREIESVLRRAGSGRTRPRGGRRLAQPARQRHLRRCASSAAWPGSCLAVSHLEPGSGVVLVPVSAGGAAVTAYSWPLCSYLELGALPTAVPCARLHARHLVWEWGLDGLAENAELLVSELVTNAVQAMAGQDDQSAVCLRLSSDNTRLLIEVWDADPRPPAPKDLGADGIPDLEEEGGRGLFLVAALSRALELVPHAESHGQSRLVRACG